jgi:hypothetical protein
VPPPGLHPMTALFSQVVRPLMSVATLPASVE